MKPKRSCELCSSRHRKCVMRPGSTKCNGCEEVDKECLLVSKFQFRAEGRAPARKGRKQPGSHPTPESHVDDQGEGTGAPRHHARNPSEHTEFVNQDASDGYTTQLNVDALSEPLAAPETRLTSRYQSTIEAPSFGARQDSALIPPSNAVHFASAGLSRREAFLFRLWVQKLSLSADGVDDARRFGYKVSRLALRNSMILYAVLALASRYDAMATNSTCDLESTYYQSRCIELLIISLSRPPEEYDTNLLIAVLVSSLYEETHLYLETSTSHLKGARNLLSSGVISRLAKEGGLAEAACWVHLRQTIYVAISRRRRVDIPLTVYDGLPAFERDDDSSYANRAVYLFARGLNTYFDKETWHNASKKYQWATLEQEVSLWFDKRPDGFKPLFHEDTDPDNGRPFPSLWMMTMTQAVALQYYHATIILLGLEKSNSIVHSGFEAAKERTRHEKDMSRSLCAMMGLALSNEHALNIWYMPCHLLGLCGYCIRHPTERVQTLKYLQRATQAVQWKTTDTADTLKLQWHELDGFQV